MAISAPEKLDGQAVRSELLAIYRGRTGQGFLQSLLDTLSDPDSACESTEAATLPSRAGDGDHRCRNRGVGIRLLHRRESVIS